MLPFHINEKVVYSRQWHPLKCSPWNPTHICQHPVSYLKPLTKYFVQITFSCFMMFCLNSKGDDRTGRCNVFAKNTWCKNCRICLPSLCKFDDDLMHKHNQWHLMTNWVTSSESVYSCMCNIWLVAKLPQGFTGRYQTTFWANFIQYNQQT